MAVYSFRIIKAWVSQRFPGSVPTLLLFTTPQLQILINISIGEYKKYPTFQQKEYLFLNPLNANYFKDILGLNKVVFSVYYLHEIIYFRYQNRSFSLIKTNFSSNLYLVDSGGQYLDGTTDVTRTFHYGTPSQEQVITKFVVRTFYF